jgi:hypothetical protein
VTLDEKRAEYYEQMAAETRARAEAMTDFQACETMLRVAQMWEVIGAGA